MDGCNHFVKKITLYQERCVNCFEKELIEESFPINIGYGNWFYTRDS